MFTKKQQFLPPEEWVMFKDETCEIVPAIVSEEIWDKANEVLARRSEDAKTAKETVLSALGKRANVAITDAIEGNNALYNPDEDIIYISNGEFDGSAFNTEDISRAIALHEVTHKAEGTPLYTAMLDEVQKIWADENAPEEIKALVGDRVQRRREIIQQYWDRDLSREQNRYVADTELVSNMIGDLLGNSYFVERMSARNDGAWKRFVSALRVTDDGRAAGISKETQKYLSGLYKSYVKAVDASEQGVKILSMVNEGEKEKAAYGAVVSKEGAQEEVSNTTSEDKRGVVVFEIADDILNRLVAKTEGLRR